MPVETATAHAILRKNGFNILTGEACAYGTRLLTDVTDQAQTSLANFLGLRDISCPENWNPGSTGSIMLPRDIILPLAVFCELAKWGTRYVIVEGDNVHTYFDADCEEECTRSREALSGRPHQIFSKKSGPGSGGRMQHQFSGRTE